MFLVCSFFLKDDRNKLSQLKVNSWIEKCMLKRLFRVAHLVLSPCDSKVNNPLRIITRGCKIDKENMTILVKKKL